MDGPNEKPPGGDTPRGGDADGRHEKIITLAEVNAEIVKSSERDTGEIAKLSKPKRRQKRAPETDYGSVALDFTVSGRKVAVNVANISLMLNAAFMGAIRFDTFRQRMLWNGLVVNDDAALALTVRVQNFYHDGEFIFAKASDETVYKALRLVAVSNAFNSAAEQLRALPKWDGTPRIGEFFVDVCGIDRNAYALGVGRYFWLTLTQRIIAPGARADSAVVLTGAQGQGKTTLLRIIGGDSYGEASFEKIGSPDWAMKNIGRTVVEFSEFAGHRRAEVDTIKSVLSQTHDRFRAPYGRTTEEHARGHIFAGTTNEAQFLTDDTGNRRWLPVVCAHPLALDIVEANRAQLFAEALHLIDSGDAGDYWTIPNATNEQAARVVREEWTEPLDEKLRGDDRLLPLAVANSLIYEKLGVPTERQTGATGRRIAVAMRALGFTSGTWRNDAGAVVRGYRRETDGTDATGASRDPFPL